MRKWFEVKFLLKMTLIEFRLLKHLITLCQTPIRTHLMKIIKEYYNTKYELLSITINL